jgi:excisionase family DNA binding protein
LKGAKEERGGMEHKLMTVKDVAEYMRLSEQTIQRWVLKKEIPFHKVKKVIRFRFSEVERWINEGGGKCPVRRKENHEGDLFGEAGTDGEEACCPAAVDGQEVQA